MKMTSNVLRAQALLTWDALGEAEAVYRSSIRNFLVKITRGTPAGTLATLGALSYGYSVLLLLLSSIP